MSRNYDAVVVGAGHNGLVCANYLARAGSQGGWCSSGAPIVGGAAVTEEIAPGFRASIFSYLMSLLHPRIIRDFDLKALRARGAALLRHGLAGSDARLHRVLATTWPRPRPASQNSRAHDAEIYPAFDALSARGDEHRAASCCGRRRSIPPSATGARSATALGFLWRYRRIGRNLYRIVDLLTMTAYDFLKEWFEDDRIMAVLAYYASIGTFAGPKTPGSAYVIMHHLMGEHEGAGGWGFIKGGMGAITQALAAYGRRHGVEIFTDCAVAKIETANGRATGVVTADGDGLSRADGRRQRQCQASLSRSRAASSSAGRVGARDQGLPDLLDRIQDQHRLRTAAAIEAPRQLGPRRSAASTIRPMCMSRPTSTIWSAPMTMPSMAGTRRAAVHHAGLPTIVDDIGAAGQACGNLFGGHAPYTLKDGAGRRRRTISAKYGARHAGEFAPAFSDDVIATQVLVAPDIERDRRPAARPHLSRRALAGSAVLPAAGGALCRLPHADRRALPVRLLGASGRRRVGHPGHNAAREILRDVKHRRPAVKAEASPG